MRNTTKQHKGNYVKHLLIISGVAIPILLIFIFIFVVPFGSEYKSIKLESKILEREVAFLKTKREEVENNYFLMDKNNYKMMNEFNSPKEMEKLKDENPFIEKITHLKNSGGEVGLFIKDVYQIETKFLYTTLENIYDLMKNSKEYGLRFNINFPIILEAKKSKLKSAFNINVYRLKPVKKDNIRPYTDIQK